MASRNASVKDWAVAELRKMLGFQEVEEIATYLLSIQNPTELMDYMMQLLGDEGSVTAFAQKLIEKRNHSTGVGLRSAVSASSVDSTHRKGERTTRIEGKTTPSFPKPSASSAPVPSGSSSNLYVKPSRQEQYMAGAGRASAAAVRGPAESKPGAAFGNLTVKQQASKKKVGGTGGKKKEDSNKGKVRNCLFCGKIEFDGAARRCTFCGKALDGQAPRALTEEEKEAELIAQATAESLGENGRDTKDQEELEKALRHKERLLEFDRNAAKRTQVYDDQVDYFSTANSAWVSEEERKRALEKAEQRREAAKRSGRNVKVAIDFGGRRVLVEEKDPSEEESKGSGDPEREGGEELPSISSEAMFPMIPGTSLSVTSREEGIYRNHMLSGRAHEVYESLSQTLAERRKAHQAAGNKGLEKGEKPSGGESGSTFSMWSSPLMLSSHSRLQHSEDVRVI